MTTILFKARFNFMKKNIFFILFIVLLTSCKKEKTDLFSVVYEVEFISTWSANTHPTDFPANAHFSPFVAVAHLTGAQLFTVGLNASEGIKEMAETGATNKLENEITQWLNGSIAVDKAVGNTFNSPGNSNKVQIGVREGYHTITAVSMIAPSPDWFVATQTALYDAADGMWYDEVISNVAAYDAGTDSGVTFNSADDTTTPVAPINFISIDPLTEGQDTVVNMGYFKFVRVQ